MSQSTTYGVEGPSGRTRTHILKGFITVEGNILGTQLDGLDK